MYLVCGETGEYSDHSDWPVEVFATEAQALAKAAELNAWCKANGVDGKCLGRWEQVQALQATAPDKSFFCDYTGTSYFVVPVEANL
jgi:hypothetical protein